MKNAPGRVKACTVHSPDQPLATLATPGPLMVPFPKMSVLSGQEWAFILILTAALQGTLSWDTYRKPGALHTTINPQDP